MVGFQTRVGAENFCQLAQRFAAAVSHDDGVMLDGRLARVGCFPISVDVDQFEELAASREVLATAAELRSQLGRSRKIMLGVDRLDYTKGIDLRLRAFQDLLRSQHLSADDCVYIQLAVPTRERVDDYRQLREEVERLVGAINGEFGEQGRMPVQYLHRSVGLGYLVALYAVADVMLVTPLHDGMNLVAKEYVASSIADTGALVLSEFTGAAHELRSALLVNPYDISAMVETMARGLTMSPHEQAVRMKSMRRVIRENDVYHWANTFCSLLDYARV